MVSFGNTSITIVAVIGVLALVALVVAWFLRGWVLRQHEGTPGMQALAAAVQELSLIHIYPARASAQGTSAATGRRRPWS